MHELEKGVTTVDRVPISFVPIFDGMALVRMIQCLDYLQPDPVSYLQRICRWSTKICSSKKFWIKRIDIVLDVYYKNSIKNAGRGNRSTGKLQFKLIVCSSKIKQWGAFLSNGKNKAELIRFLVSRWKSQSSIIADAKLYVAFDEKCICIKTLMVPVN